MAITTNTINRQIPGGDNAKTVNFSSAGVNTAGGEIIIADPGASVSIAIEQILINYHADDTVTLREDTDTIIGGIVFKAAGNGFFVYKPTDPLILAANKELNILSLGANAISGIVDYHLVP